MCCGANEIFLGLMKCAYRPCGANGMCLSSLWPVGLMKCVYRPCGGSEV